MEHWNTINDASQIARILLLPPFSLVYRLLY